jgi:hypothetical protein
MDADLLANGALYPNYEYKSPDEIILVLDAEKKKPNYLSS